MTDDDEDDEPVWEFSAREAVEEAIANAVFDDLKGAIEFSDPHEPRRKTACDNFDEVQRHLVEVYDSEWNNHVPYDGGEGVFEPDATDTVDDAIRKYDVEDFFLSSLTQEEHETELISSASETLLEGGSQQIKIDSEEINAELVRYLATHPEKMHDLNPRKFEELVAALFQAKGYDVELGSRGADGGVDVYALKKTLVGSVLILVQCKRYGAEKTVGVKVVRELYGLVEAKSATKGFIATTSTFTKNAKAERETIKFRMDFADKLHLQKLLQDHVKEERRKLGSML